jgi:VWFA-related protein
MQIRPASLLLSALVCATASLAQAPTASQPAADNTILLDVVVTAKPRGTPGPNDPPVTGFTQQDFTLLDNKTPQPILSFRPPAGKQASVTIALVLDAANTDVQEVAVVRAKLEVFLRANDGKLAHPTTLVVLTDTGLQMQHGYSQDGNALSQVLEAFTVPPRATQRNSGHGLEERYHLSVSSLITLTDQLAKAPGHKIVVWFSPGWPLLSSPELTLTAKQQQEIFSNVVKLSTRMTDAGVTLYSVNPLGSTADDQDAGFTYRDFLKPLVKVSQTDFGYLGLQVLALQSGGLAIEGNNDYAGLIQHAIAEAESSCTISFMPHTAARPNEFHSIEIKLDKPGLVARTRQGYYAQP